MQNICPTPASGSQCPGGGLTRPSGSATLVRPAHGSPRPSLRTKTSASKFPRALYPSPEPQAIAGTLAHLSRTRGAAVTPAPPARPGSAAGEWWSVLLGWDDREQGGREAGMGRTPTDASTCDASGCVTDDLCRLILSHDAHFPPCNL